MAVMVVMVMDMIGVRLSVTKTTIPCIMSRKLPTHDPKSWKFFFNFLFQAPYLEQKFKKIYQGDAYKYVIWIP